MTGWLEGKRLWLVGGGPALAIQFAAHGAVPGDDLQTSDILVHVAEPQPVAATHAIDPAVWRRAIDSGLDDRFRHAQQFAAAAREAGRTAAILFIGAPEQAHGSAHAAAAAALTNLTRTLAVEWARDGIRVNTILSQDRGAALASLAAYLASDLAAYVTGIVTGIGLADFGSGLG